MVRKYRLLIGLLAVSWILMAFSYPAHVGQEKRGIAWWVWILIILLLAILIGWLLGLGSKKKEEGPATEVDMAMPSRAVEVPAPAVEVAPPAEEEVELPAPDDLKRIEGIGPKISGLLQTAGITTFAQLAQTDVSRLEQIVRGAGITIADPTTWPDQAKLAAAGRWDELETLQGELKGGRRV